MKKILLMSFFTLLFLQACKKDQELIDNKKPEERVAEAIDKYSKELISSEGGWVATIKTTVIEGTYSFYMNFNKLNRVTMLADYDSEAVESTYRIKYVMAPSIIFDTYSLLHYLQDPNPRSFNGESGQGYGSDFEFEIREQVGDTIKLVGKKRLAELTLVKATAADKEFYATTIDNLNDYLTDNPYLYIPDPKTSSDKIQVSINPDPRLRTFTLTSLQNNLVTSGSSTFRYNTKTGLILSTPLVYNGLTIVAVNWDNTNGKLFLITESGSKIEVLKSNVPIMPLHFVMGITSKFLDVPGIAALPGSSTSFVTAYNNMRTAVANRFTVPTIARDLGIQFDDASKTFVVYMTVVQNGTNAFDAIYTYSYTKTANGEYKFVGPPRVGGGAGAAVLPQMNTFLLNRLVAQTFTLDYYNDTPNGRVLGVMISKETPTFFFTGIIE